jgi:regulator of sigma E protease
MNTLLGIVLVLGVMILVHEWGHFIVARLFGVRVDVFSIGFGPRLFGWKRGATDYRVSALPLGGYVRMAGQDLTEIDSGEKGPTGAPDEVMSKPRWQRALISFAGPAVNLLMPLLLLGGFFWIRGYPYQKYLEKPAVIASISEKDPLAKEGIVPGDTIVEVNGVATPNWEAAENALAKAAQDPSVQVAVQHSGVVKKIDIKTAGQARLEDLRWYMPDMAVVAEVVPGKPAAKAGLRTDDVLVSVGGTKVTNQAMFIDLIQKTHGAPQDVLVERGGKLLTFKVQPEPNGEKGEDGQPIYKVGVSIVPKPDWSFRKQGFRSAVVKAGETTWNWTVDLIGVLGKLFSGRLSVKQLSGVVGIAYQAGRAVQEGSFAVVSLMAVISVNLGILNLLPIPILDGGHILLLSIEGIRRRDLSLAFKERFIQVGLVFLLLLFAIVMYNDVMRHLPIRS